VTARTTRRRCFWPCRITRYFQRFNSILAAVSIREVLAGPSDADLWRRRGTVQRCAFRVTSRIMYIQEMVLSQFHRRSLSPQATISVSILLDPLVGYNSLSHFRLTYNRTETLRSDSCRPPASSKVRRFTHPRSVGLARLPMVTVSLSGTAPGIVTVRFTTVLRASCFVWTSLKIPSFCVLKDKKRMLLKARIVEGFRN
jgi:hypothetical protein